MESNDFLESLHIPKDQNDIQKQLDTLGTSYSQINTKAYLLWKSSSPRRSPKIYARRTKIFSRISTRSTSPTKGF